MDAPNVPNGTMVIVAESALHRLFAGWNSGRRFHVGSTCCLDSPGDGITLPGVLVNVSFVQLEESEVTLPMSVKDARILAIAKTIAEHWRDQEGVNAALLDQLAEAAR